MRACPENSERLWRYVIDDPRQCSRNVERSEIGAVLRLVSIIAPIESYLCPVLLKEMGTTV